MRRAGVALLPAALLAAAALLAPAAAAGHGAPPALEAARVEERLGEQLPLDLTFTDAAGRPVRLRDEVSGDRPVLLVLAYYHCARLCGLVLRGLADGLRALDWELGTQYRALAVSFDPEDRPYDAGRQQASVLHRLGRPDAAASWPFLVGEAQAIRTLTDRVGFRYRYDPAGEQFAHPAVVFVLTPQGRLSRYLYGIEFEPRDLKLALLEASEGRTGSAFERILMRCYRYDPATRTYGLYVAGFLKGGAFLVLAVLGGTLGVLWRREARRSGSS